LDIRNFNGFIAAAELMNFTLAAQRLNITQSALSRQIKGLEDYLGVELFEKSGRNVRLTAHGDALLDKINDVVVADKSLRVLADNLGSGESGALKLGACSQLIERYLPTFLKKWTGENPGVSIRIEDGGGPELAGKLRAGSVHLTISARPMSLIDPFETVSLGRLGFLAVATEEFLANETSPVEMADLLHLPILTLNQRHASREVFDAACKLAGTAPSIVLESYSPHTLFAMAEGGIGVAVVPSSAVKFGPPLVGRSITLKGQTVHFDICAMWSYAAPLPDYGVRFVQALKDHIVAENLQDALW
jgi:DNA-binding transcriptional LysR family regulator